MATPLPKVKDLYMRRLPNKRIPAFTIMELTVVISISAILMMGVYHSFHFFNQLYYGFSEKLHSTEMLFQFENQLRLDFRDAGYVQGEGKVLRMVYPEKRVQYSFGRDFVIREQAFRQDTIKLGVLRYYTGEVENKDGDRLIESLQASFTDEEGVEHAFYISRDYTPERLLKTLEK